MHSFFRRFLQLFCLLFIMLGVVLALLPKILSSEWGRNQVVKGVNHFIPGEIEVHSLQLQWTKIQIIRGLVLKDLEGNPILKIERLSIEAPFWKLLTASIHLGFIQIKEMSAMLAFDDKGYSNFLAALGMAPVHETLPIPSLFLSHVNAHFHLFADHHPLSLWAQGVTQQRDLDGSFELNLVLNGLRATHWENLFSDIQHYFNAEGSKRANLQLAVSNFPTSVIDHFFSFAPSLPSQFFHSFMGHELSVVLNKESNTEGNLTVKIQAPFLKGNMHGKLAKGVFVLQEPALFQLDIDPHALYGWAHPYMQLQHIARVNVTFPYLWVPLASLHPQKPFDFCQCGFKVDLSMNNTLLNIDPLGFTNVHHLTAQLESASLNSKVNFKGKGYVEYDQKQRHIQYEKNFEISSDFSSFLKNRSLEALTSEF